MRKALFVVLALAVTVGAAVGAWKTGFLQKAVWVFQSSALAAPGGGRGFHADGGQGGPGFQAGGRGPSGAPPAGGRAGREGGFGEGGGMHRGGEALSGAGIDLRNVGWFALIMAFFAAAAYALDRLARARRKKPRLVA